MSLIYDVDILDEAKENFLTFASEVLTDRAIPSAEDGLLSAQRKILWTMEDYLKMDSKSKTKKCNALVGSTLATSYFHGDASCYGVLCKMSQDYLMRYPLIVGQGSLGTQENNELYASSRYTEARPSIYADLMMIDFKKNVVPVKETYNGEYMEPVVLPGLFPNALCNGRQAIGVSISHNSLPHNATEVCEGIVAFLQRKIKTVSDLLKYIPGPDFPLGGKVLNTRDIKAAFETGHSTISLKVQGDYVIEKNKIIFTTIPYRTYRNKIKEQIEKNVDELEQVIEDFDDESSIGENKLVFYIKKGIDPSKALQKIFALTDLQTSLSYNMNFIINGTPKLCSMIQLIEAYCNHQENVLIKATEYDYEKAQARAHILRGLIAAVDKIDEVVQIIKSAEDKKTAVNELINFLSIDSIQANAILEMKLGRLTRIDKNELINELKEKEKIITYCKELLESKDKRVEKLITLITNLKNKYGDNRRTQLLDVEELKEEKEKLSIISEDCVVLANDKEIIRVPLSKYKTQNRNSKGIKNQDSYNFITTTNTTEKILAFTSTGRVYPINVHLINESKTAFSSLIKTEINEKIVLVTNYNNEDKYLCFVTANGLIKKTRLEEFNVKRSSQATKLREGDSLVGCFGLNNEQVILFTTNGLAIRFDSTSFDSVSKNAVGIKGITLNENDTVKCACKIKDDFLLIAKQSGLGVLNKVSEFPSQNRAGKGIIYSDEPVAQVINVNQDNEIIVNGNNSTIREKVSSITPISRGSKGIQLIKNSRIISVSKV